MCQTQLLKVSFSLHTGIIMGKNANVTLTALLNQL